jgi:branched-chain amino acid transport system permease protein
LEFALITFLNGLGYGFLLFLLSSGLTLIYSMMGVPNFAHASFYMLGAYVAYALAGVLGFWWALLLAPLIVGVAGALVEHYGLRIVHRYGHVPELLFTFGLSYLVVELVQLVWGARPCPTASRPNWMARCLRCIPPPSRSIAASCCWWRP